MTEEFISRVEAVKAANEWVSEACMAPVMRVSRLFDKLAKVPAADVAEVVRGQWCVSKIRSIETVFYCSECKRTVTVGNDFFGEAPQSVSAAYPYCHCGAKMDGGNDDATD